MGHHIDDQGRFQSDKYPDLPPDKVVVSLKDPPARDALVRLVVAYLDVDAEFATDLGQRLVSLSDELGTHDLVEITLGHYTEGIALSDGLRTKPGWWWWESEYPEEGFVGPYQDRQTAIDCMPDTGVITTYKPEGE